MAAQHQRTGGFGYSRQQRPVRAAVMQWSACMKGRGFDHPDPCVPVKDVRFQGPRTAAAIATAVADVVGKDKSNLAGLWFTVKRSYQPSLAARNRDGLDRLRQVDQVNLAAARILP